jgi:hypothetical protein
MNCKIQINVRNVGVPTLFQRFRGKPYCTYGVSYFLGNEMNNPNPE